MNPLDWTGPEFLKLYIGVLFVAIFLALALWWLLRQPEGNAVAEELENSHYESAYLAGGAQGATDAATVRLIQHGALSLDPINLRLERKAKGLPEKVHPLEKSVYEAVDAEAGSLLSTVRRNTATAADRLRGRLDQLGLLIPANRVGLVHFAPVAVVGIVALFGIAKIFVGISRHRPVGYLFMLVISTCALGFLLYWLPCFRSRRGDATIEKLKRNNKALEYTAGRRGYALTDDDLVMAIGLFGVGVLAGGPLAHLATPFRAVVPSRVTSGSTSCSSWWTSCSSSSCSGGGGGGCGGGCGGGGCGGCGG